MFSVTVRHDQSKRGRALPSNQRAVAERLRSQGLELQRRFELAESTALLLSEMLDQSSDVASSLNNTYEAYAFVRLRLQLFRILLVDITACVLDSSKGAGSVAAIIKELRTRPKSLDAVKDYYADPESLVVTIEGKDLTAQDIEREKLYALQRSVEDSRQSMERQWSAIKKAYTQLMENNATLRMKWARDKLVAHFEKSTDGLVPLDAIPPVGNGKLQWLEPVMFIDSNRQTVYDTFALVTSTSWGNERVRIAGFYARSFWDRLKNGTTKLRYNALEQGR